MKKCGNLGRRAVPAVILLVLGLVLTGCAAAEILDEFWSGMGASFLVISVLRLIQLIRYRKNSEYREAVDTAMQDERNRYIANKAWAWAGYLFVILAAVATIGLKLMGEETLMMMSAGAVCLMVLLYWGSWMILRRKY